MQKTKLGISTGLLGAIIFLTAFLSTFYSAGTFALLLLIIVAYVFTKEDDLTLKTEAATASVLALLYFFIDVIFNFVPEFLNFLNFFLQFANIKIYDKFGITNFIFLFITWTFKILFIILTFMAFSGKTINLRFITKHIQ